MGEESVFEGDVGSWDAEVIVRPAPGAPEVRSQGLAVQKLVGKWLISDFKNDTGFDGHGIYGWDATRKRYVGTWVDPMRSFLCVMEGDWDATARRMTFHAEARTPDGKTLRWREVTEHVDEKTRLFRQFWDLPDGEHELMTVTYRKR
jgi:Protein of unknown function (DUF1579)